MTKSDIRTLIAGVATIVAAGALHFAGAATWLQFIVSGIALATLATLIGHSTENIGTRLSPGATGVLQSAVGNLPEIFVCIFALRAGLVDVVRAALVGSILANSLLVFGVAILMGGLKNGRQSFHTESARITSSLLLLAVSAMAVPTLVHYLHTPAEQHADKLSAVTAGLLLVCFILSIPYSLSSDETTEGADGDVQVEHEPGWPMGQAVAVLIGAGLSAAFVSEWFVGALEPTMKAVGISEAFAGFVIVAIAGNAVENVVGIRLAVKNKMDYAVSVMLNSSLQVALAVVPILVLLSFVIGGPILTLVMPPLLVVGLLLTTMIVAVIVGDGHTVWLEGVTLIGLYGIIAVSLWWG